MIRSVQQMRGIGIDAIDGPIGEIHDVYFDDHDWRVRYYIVSTGKWLPGREVLIPPQAVRQRLIEAVVHAIDVHSGRELFPVHVREVQVAVDRPQLSCRAPEGKASLGAQVDDSNGGRLTHRLDVSHEQHCRTLAGCLHNSSQLFPRHSVEGLVVDHADVCPDPVLVNGQGYLERPPPCRLVAELGPH